MQILTIRALAAAGLLTLAALPASETGARAVAPNTPPAQAGHVPAVGQAPSVAAPGFQANVGGYPDPGFRATVGGYPDPGFKAYVAGYPDPGFHGGSLLRPRPAGGTILAVPRPVVPAKAPSSTPK